MTRFRTLSIADKLKNVAAGLAFIVLCVAVIGGIWVTLSYFEARSYNHVTQANVSTWDAMFIQLRVQAPADCR